MPRLSTAAYQPPGDLTAREVFSRSRFGAPGAELEPTDQFGELEVRTSADFIVMLSAFAQPIQPRWEMVAASEEGANVFVLYKLFTGIGTPAFCADHFVVRDGKITNESLVFDPFPFRAPE